MTVKNMIYILFGKPLVFWFGIIAFMLFFYQIYLGLKMAKGNFGLLPRHRFNAFILFAIVIIHLLLGLSLYL